MRWGIYNGRKSKFHVDLYLSGRSDFVSIAQPPPPPPRPNLRKAPQQAPSKSSMIAAVSGFGTLRNKQRSAYPVVHACAGHGPSSSCMLQAS